MPDLDPSIALSFKQADPMKSLSSMLTTANDALTYKRNQATFDADVQQKQATASSAGSKATVDAANVQPLIGQQAAQTSSAQTKASADQFGLHKDYANTALQTASGLLSDPAITATGPNYNASNVAKAITGAVDQMVAKGVPREQAMQAGAPLFMKMHEEGGVANYLKSTVLGGMAPASQATAITPSGIGVANGAGSAVISNNPFTPQSPVGTALSGTRQTAQPPPTTPTVGGVNGTTPGIFGPRPDLAPGAEQPAQGVNAADHPAVSRAQQQSADTDRVAIYSQERQQLAAQAQQAQASGDPAAIARAQQDQANLEREIVSNRVQMPAQAQSTPPKQSGFMATGLDPGQSGNMEDNTNLMNTHYSKLSGNASDAQTAIGLTGNIKALAQGAATGTEAGRKAYVVGLLNSLHLGGQVTGDLQKDTDLLEKNMAQLNLATPASSDAGRTLVSAARPHGTMNAAAINEAADQVASQVQANLAVRNYLTPYKYAAGGKGDAQGYQSAKQDIENTADPRAWQYMNLKPGSSDAKAFMNKLNPQDKKDLVQKIGHLEQMGMLK
jgi:hypothetical protein